MVKTKLSFFVFSFFLLFLFSFSQVSAQSLVVIQNDGKIVTTVLGTEDSKLNIPQSDNLTIQKVANADEVSNSKISLFKDGENVKLALDTEAGKNSMDVTDYKSGLVEIEETPQKQKLQISLKDGSFKIQQGEMAVITKYPIEIDPETKKISVKTESGIKYLSILPKDASDILLRAKTINSIDPTSENTLEDSDGALVYKLTGNKKVNLFNVTDYETKVESKVNASTGEIAYTNEPVWLKLLSFFLK